MKIAKRTDYAFRTVLELAHYPGRLLSAADIARRRKIPIKFLEQILGVLKRGGIVNSERGQKGGYVLARDACELNLAEIIRLFEGDIALMQKDDTVNSNGVAGRSMALSEIWTELSDHITKRLEEVTFKDLCSQDEKLASHTTHDFVI